MFKKINIGIGIITIILLITRLLNPDFEPFPNFIFVWITVMFLLLSLQFFKEDTRGIAFLYLSVSIISLFIVVI